MTHEENETYRGAIHTRRPDGGEPCTLLVRRANGRVQLLHHAVLSTGAELTDEQIDDLLGHLTAARQARTAREQR